MNPVVIIVAVLLILGIVPFFILIGNTCSDIRETERKSKQNEKEIHQMIYGDDEKDRE